MKNFLTYALANPELAFVLVLVIGLMIIQAGSIILNRILRTIKVCVRGWPTPPNMDADGDIVHNGSKNE